jgi:uncharacterized protein (TIGR02246 family)
MSRLLCVIIFLFFCSTTLVGQTRDARTAPVSDTLVALAQEWVDTWNNKDVERMRRLHADDVSIQLYALGEEFVTIEKLLKEIRKENFWKLSWSIKIVQPHVRMLGADAALVAFRVVGKETHSYGSSRPYSAAFSLVFQRYRDEWKIVHVHDSSGPVPRQK